MAKTTKYANELETAEAVALKAGALIRDEFYRPGGPRGSGGHHADVDDAADALIVSALKAAFPADAIVAEESGRHGPAGAKRTWYVDPNDGTSAYLEGHRGSAVSIALVVGGRPVLGVVYAPLAPDDAGDLFTWAEGEPLRRNGREVVRAPFPSALGALSVVALNHKASRHPAQSAARTAPARFVAVPSIAYRLALAAVGEVDAAVSTSGPTHWDVAGGHALVLAAGGDLFDAAGKPFRYGTGGTGASDVFGGHPDVALQLAKQAHARAPQPEADALSQAYPHAAPGHSHRVKDASLLSRAHGALLGQLAGDALGQLVEFKSRDAVKRTHPDGVRDLVDGGTWGTLAGQPTDDSELALMLARSIVREGAFVPERVREAYQAWLASRPFDVGTTTRAGLTGHPNHASASNGSAMRVSPLAIHASALGPDAVAELAAADARLTHPGPVSVCATQVLAVGIALAVREGPSPRALYEQVAAWVRARPQLPPEVREVFAGDDVAPVRDFHTHEGWVVVALRNAFHQLLHAPSLEEGLVRTVSVGGDADTNGAIAGALLGAVYGRDAVPQRWRRLVLSCRAASGRHPRPAPFWGDDALEIAERLIALGAHTIAPRPERRDSTSRATVFDAPPRGVGRSAGGVVVHPDGARVLLRRPTPNPGYDDLDWTHAKGGLKGEAPEEAALREVREELGVEAEVVAELSGWFRGNTTGVTKYFVMRWVRDAGAPDDETAEVRWATWDEAVGLMRQRACPAVERDVAVLGLARAFVRSTGAPWGPRG